MLYRFYSDSMLSYSSLANNYLWFSNICDFNDPFEEIATELPQYESVDEIDESKFIEIFKKISLPQMTPSMKEQALLKAFMGPNKRDFMKRCLDIHESTHKRIMNQFTQTKWCCFTEDDEQFGSPIQRKLMWSHYANGLRGFLVGYKREGLFVSFDKQNSGRSLMTKIKYGDLKKTSFYDALLEASTQEKKEAMFSLKSNEWAYETELRLGGDNSKMYYYPSAVREVIVGEKMSQDFKDMLISLINGNKDLAHVSILEAYIDRIELDIKTRPLTKIDNCSKILAP